ncbi:CD9 antigen-like [Lethenteron reissneri]|uniref:CD9 antigen-like n=1 Tax=Lethenteron reissneri TaxID=7753 RepID=UPI002AB6FA03|nr:CD9 antigen-like [Lethenteron reissneri]
MGLAACLRCMKFVLVAFNFLFWLVGCALLSISLWLRFDQNTKDIFDNPNAPTTYYVGIYVLIVVGALMMVVGFLGCCGAIQESQCMLGTFFTLIVILFAAEITAAIWAFMFHDEVETQMIEYYNGLYNDKGNSTRSATNTTLSIIHSTLDCCGQPKLNYTSQLSTYSCPPEYTKNCVDEIRSFLGTKVYIVAGLALGVAVIMIFGMIFSMAVCCAIRNDSPY